VAFSIRKKTSYGSGVVLSELEIKQLAGMLGIVVAKHSASFSKDLKI
jgi:hypothetical protein